jgi:pyrroline-5-carboxylate reductase
MPTEQLLICHRGSQETARQLIKCGLSQQVVEADEVAGRSKMLLYVVRPQDYHAIGDHAMPQEALLISFLAGVQLADIPVAVSMSQRVRVMPSTPDTVLRKDGIAGLFPADHVGAHALLSALGLRPFPLRAEGDIHAFTVLGPCLPVVLTHWERLGHPVMDTEVLKLGAAYGLSEYAEVWAWALAARPRHLSTEGQSRYVAQAATPGGVTEAILRSIDKGEALSTALQCGIRRSRELGEILRADM